jgi:hypothetical protein
MENGKSKTEATLSSFAIVSPATSAFHERTDATHRDRGSLQLQSIEISDRRRRGTSFLGQHGISSIPPAPGD